MAANVTRIALTTEDLERLPEPEQGGGYELDEGEPVYVSPNNLEQAQIIVRIYNLLKEFVSKQGLGLVAPDSWFELAPGIVRAPDVAFVPARRLGGIDPKHALKVVPALAVEVLSQFSTPREISRKIQQYRDAGVEKIWVVDPEKREVDIHSAQPLRTLRRDDVLEEPELLPGLSVRVSDLFE